MIAITLLDATKSKVHPEDATLGLSTRRSGIQTRPKHFKQVIAEPQQGTFLDSTKKYSDAT